MIIKQALGIVGWSVALLLVLEILRLFLVGQIGKNKLYAIVKTVIRMWQVAALLSVTFAVIIAVSVYFLPPTKANAAELDTTTWGYTHIVCESAEDECDSPRSRIRSFSTHATGTNYLVEVDFAHAQRNEINWLHQLWFSRKVGEWQIGAGRVFTGAGGFTPPYFLLETVNYPRAPISLYGYGLQAKGPVGRWDIVADITGSTSGNFRDFGGDRGELSFRALRKLNQQIEMGAYGQLSPDFQRWGIGTTITRGKTFVRARGYFVQEERSPDKTGGFVLLERKILPWAILHSQIDHQQFTKVDSTVNLVGIRFFDKKGDSLIVDREVPNVGDGRTIVRLQRKFNF